MRSISARSRSKTCCYSFIQEELHSICREGEKKLTFSSWKHPNLVGGFHSKKKKEQRWRSLKQDPFSEIGVSMTHVWTSPHWEFFTTKKWDGASWQKQVRWVIVIGLIWPNRHDLQLLLSSISHPGARDFMGFFPKHIPGAMKKLVVPSQEKAACSASECTLHSQGVSWSFNRNIQVPPGKLQKRCMIYTPWN